MSVVRLVDKTSSPISGDDMLEWVTNWLQAFLAGDMGQLRTLILVAENSNGQVGTVSQCVTVLDTARLVGLLQYAAHLRMQGAGRHSDMQQ